MKKQSLDSAFIVLLELQVAHFILHSKLSWKYTLDTKSRSNYSCNAQVACDEKKRKPVITFNLVPRRNQEVSDQVSIWKRKI